MNFKNFTIATAIFALGIFLAMFVSLLGFVDPAHLGAVLSSDRVMFSISLSLKAAFVSTLLSMLLAIPAGYALSRFEFRGKELIDTLLEIPLMVTPVALGAMLLIFLNSRAGEILQNNLWSFVFEFSGIVLAQFLTTVGLAIRMIKNTFDDIPRRFEAVACSLGASAARAFTSITLPMARKGILAAIGVTFAKCMGEFGATAMVAGAMPNKSETLPISIFIRLGSADLEGMAIMILILLTVGISVIVILKYILKARYD